jgi:threonine/homoserine/homoserine lactone efflux protein
VSTVLAFALASAVVVAIPGPSILFTIGRALSAGRREALLTVAGNALGILTQIVALAVGLGPVIAASATAYTVLKVVGAAYLVWLGIQAVRHRRAVATALVSGVPTSSPTLHALRNGYVVGVTNPKSFVLLAALLPQFVDPPRGRVGGAGGVPVPGLVRPVPPPDGAGRRSGRADDGRARHRPAPHGPPRLTQGPPARGLPLIASSPAGHAVSRACSAAELAQSRDARRR